MLELEDTFSTIMVTADSDKHEIVPECVLNYFRKNLELFRNALEIKRILGMETCLHEVVEIMDELQAAGGEEVDIDEVVNSVKAWADMKLRDLIKDIDLSGDEVLTLLNQGMTAKLERIFDDVLSEARSMIKKRSGVEFDPFIKSYPLKIDQREVERVKRLEAASRNLREQSKVK